MILLPSPPLLFSFARELGRINRLGLRGKTSKNGQQKLGHPNPIRIAKMRHRTRSDRGEMVSKIMKKKIRLNKVRLFILLQRGLGTIRICIYMYKGHILTFTIISAGDAFISRLRVPSLMDSMITAFFFYVSFL